MNLNKLITNNFKSIKLSYLLPAIILLFVLVGFFFIIAPSESKIDFYINIQKSLFLDIDLFLSQYPIFEYNLTQLGDVLVIFSLLSFFIVIGSELWRALISAGLLSLIFTALFKTIFTVPRPAVVIDTSLFNVIGKTLCGNSSFPSGHSVSICFVLTVVMIAFMPQKKVNKFLWLLFLILITILIAFTRVGIGAHYPFDVITGCVIGYIFGVLGIIISNKTNWLKGLFKKSLLPFFCIVFIIGIGILLSRILKENLLVFYLSIFTLLISIILILYPYYVSKIKIK